MTAQGSGNPILDEIMQAHASLSPAAQKAVGMAATAGGTPPAAPAPPGMNAPIGRPIAGAPISPIRAATQGAPAGIAPAPPSLPAAPAPALPPSGGLQVKAPLGTSQGDEAERTRLLTNGPGVNEVHNPLLHGLAAVGDTVLSRALPGLASSIPGTTAHHNLLLNQATSHVNTDLAQEGKENQAADVKSQTALRGAQAEAAERKAESGEPVEITPEIAAGLGHPEYAGEKLTPALLAGLQKQAGINTTKEHTTKEEVGGRENVAQIGATSRESIGAAANKLHESLAEAANKTRVLIASMHDQTSRANNENSVAHRGAGAPGKVPADVTKRAALANNVLENSAAVDDLLKRNPDIVGAEGGRYSNVRDMIGSDDPDIAELGVRMHNIALASNGAHGIRSAEAIKQTEDELFKGFKRGPEGIHSALNATRGSMQTFLDDEKGFQKSGSRTGGDNTPAAPKEGTTKTNADGDKVVFKGGKWQPEQ